MTSPGERLPFGFARRFGVLLDTSSTPATLLLRADTPLTALAEAQRWATAELKVSTLTDAQFSERLASTYSA
ncbi:MAG: type II secretion system protein GspE, partial [Pseudomonas sp.]|nr:type II secretion system protein GspE [Pseudomonas sp.]